MQNRVAIAQPKLPQEVRRYCQGDDEEEVDGHHHGGRPDLPDGRYDSLYLGNYASRAVKDRLGGSRGWATSTSAATTACASWLDPEKLKAA
ncbi:MAG: hypothetical protein U0835_02715 [Isosphaeraceae bacterium]